QQLADHGVARADPKLAVDEVFTDWNDTLVAHGINADQRYGFKDVATACECGTGDNRRYGADLGHRVQRIAHLQPVIDGAQALSSLVLENKLDSAGLGGGPAIDFIGWLYSNVRL